MKRRERAPAILGAALLGAAAAVTGATTATAAPGPAAVDPMPHVEIGVPGEDIDGQRNAGAVEVRFSGGTIESLTAPEPQAFDEFGSAIAAYDYDADGREDLFVGAPARDVNGKADAGAVYVFHATSTGMDFERRITMDSAGLPGAAQAEALFGYSLFHDSYPVDRGSDLDSLVQIGAPGYDVGDAEDAGAVLDLDFNSFGDSALLTGNDWGGLARTGDRFGTSITENDRIRAIGAPGRTVGGQDGAGAVFYATTVENGVQAVLHQDKAGMPGAAELGDRFGRALTQSWERVYIGVPGEDIGTHISAGLVSTVLDNGHEALPEPGPNYHQNSIDEVTGEPLPGTPESGDSFGATLGWFQRAETEPTDAAARIYIGVPGEDLGKLSNSGMVNVVHHPNTPALTDRMLGGTNEANDLFGAAVYGRHEVLPLAAIGVPGEDSGTGAVRIVRPTPDIWQQATDAPEAGDDYGGDIGTSR